MAEPSKKDIQVKPVVKTPAKVKKKGKFASFVDKFFVEDVQSVVKWGVQEVAIPALKKLLVEFVDNTMNSMVYGFGTNDTRRRGSAVSNVSYREYWSRPAREEPRPSPRDDIYSFGTIEVPSERAAVDALDQMRDIISRYGLVTVAHFLEMVRIQPRSTDFNYGWTSLAGAKYRRMPNGWYEISLPRVMQIDE